jgi:hypothetical protein
MLSACLFCGWAFLTPSSAEAASYDIYVKENAEQEGADGTKAHPFPTLARAVEAASSRSSGSRKIFVGPGTYEGDVTVENSVKVYGAKRKDVVLKGRIALKKGALLKDVTLLVSGNVGIVVEPDADVVIEGCDIRGAKRIGIQALPGEGRVTVRRSTVREGGGKGIYVQEGRRVSIVDSVFSDNAEEGVDIRSRVEGEIVANFIRDNGEGGVELIVGSSELQVSDNDIRRNAASGIAFQFYAEASRKGDILLENNVIAGNKKYGLDCNIPSGGEPEAAYWSQSIGLRKNTIRENRIDAINDFCDIIDAVEEEEEQMDNLIEELPREVPPPSQEIGAAEKEQAAEAEMARELRDREESAWERMTVLLEGHDAASVEIDALERELSEKGRVRVFLFGVDADRLAALRQKVAESEERTVSLRTLFYQVSNEQEREFFEKPLKTAEAKVEAWRRLSDRYGSGLGVFGRLARWWNVL